MMRHCEVDKKQRPLVDERNKVRVKDVRKILTALNPEDFLHILILQASFTGYEFFLC